jgi:hypothetical protein
MRRTLAAAVAPAATPPIISIFSIFIIVLSFLFMFLYFESSHPELVSGSQQRWDAETSSA